MCVKIVELLNSMFTHHLDKYFCLVLEFNMFILRVKKQDHSPGEQARIKRSVWGGGGIFTLIENYD